MFTNKKNPSEFENEMNLILKDFVDEYINPLIEKEVLFNGTFIPNQEKVRAVFKKHCTFSVEDVGLRISVFNSYHDTVSCEFTYRGMNMKPESCYVISQDHRRLSMLEMLGECVDQKTFTPNIRLLQKLSEDKIGFEVKYLLDECYELDGVYNTKEEARSREKELNASFEGDGGWNYVTIIPVERENRDNGNN